MTSVLHRRGAITLSLQILHMVLTPRSQLMVATLAMAASATAYSTSRTNLNFHPVRDLCFNLPRRSWRSWAGSVYSKARDMYMLGLPSASRVLRRGRCAIIPTIASSVEDDPRTANMVGVTPSRTCADDMALLI